MDQYAVIGNPVSHSKSPKIHALFALQTSQDLEYTAIQAPLDGFAETIATFFSRGGCGLNITVPFKEEAWKLARHRTAAAEKAGAVNTLYFNSVGELTGANTDGPGLVTDITRNLGCCIKGKRVLVLGAGGAVRGVLQPLLAEAPLSITLANRTMDKAENLASLFHDFGIVKVCSFPDLQETYDLVINGTSASLSGDIPKISPACVGAAELVYDMMYAAKGTSFLHWAEQAGAARCSDGLGMLVEQAAEAFFIWRGIRPLTADILAALRLFNI